MRPLASVLVLACALSAAHADVARAADDPPTYAPAAGSDPSAAWAPDPVEHKVRLRSAPMVGVGIFLVLAGTAAIIPASVALAEPCGSTWFCDLGRFGAATIVFVGAAHVIPGAIMIGLGAQKVRVRETSVSLDLGVSPTGLSLRGSF